MTAAARPLPRPGSARAWLLASRPATLTAALVPVLGYKTSSALAREALETGRGVVELVREKGLLGEEQIAEILSPARMARPLGQG